MARFDKPNEEFWRTIKEGYPNGRFEFYDQRSGAKGIGVVVNGHVVSSTIKEGPAGWAFRNWASITHWRPDQMRIIPTQQDLEMK